MALSHPVLLRLLILLRSLRSLSVAHVVPAILAVPILLSLSSLPGFTQAAEQNNTQNEQQFTRDQVEHGFGTTPNKVYTPKTAIDTDDIPSVAFTAKTCSNDPLPYYEFSPGTYFFYGNIAEVDENNRGFNGNAGFIVTDAGVVVIDALGSPRLGKRIIATIKSVTDQPIKYLIITHNHPDHAYGAIAFRELDGVKVISHAGALKYIESDSIERSVAFRNTFIANDMKGFKPVKPDIIVGGDLYAKSTITLGGKTIDIYNTGAHHSYGDLVVHQVEDDIVWISDLAFNNRVTFMADGSSQKGIDAQTWLLDTFGEAKFMVPGHGSVQTKPFPMVTKTRSYMQRLRDDMAKAVDDGVELQTAVDSTPFEDWQDVNMYGLNHKKNVDFVYREMELEGF